jgi:hypothetical protein
MSDSQQTKQTDQGEYNRDGRPTPEGLKLGDLLRDKDRDELQAVLDGSEVAD